MQFVSDIHLEMRTEHIDIQPLPGVKNLALCGDIGYPNEEIYTKFIQRCSENFENVFVIFGNHEYYSFTRPIQTMEERRRYTEFFPKNVYFMDNRSFFIEKKTNKVFNALPKNKPFKNYVKIIGCTLWTKITYMTSLFMNDYKHVYLEGIDNYKFNLSWNKVNEFHDKSVKYILEQLDENPHVECVLLTHHGAHSCVLNEKKGSLLASAYATDIPELYLRKNLKVCVYGHTHYSMNALVKFQDHLIRFVSNQYGYPHENDVVYNEKAVIQLD